MVKRQSPIALFDGKQIILVWFDEGHPWRRTGGGREECRAPGALSATLLLRRGGSPFENLPRTHFGPGGGGNLGAFNRLPTPRASLSIISYRYFSLYGDGFGKELPESSLNPSTRNSDKPFLEETILAAFAVFWAFFFFNSSQNGFNNKSLCVSPFSISTRQAALWDFFCRGQRDENALASRACVRTLSEILNVFSWSSHNGIEIASVSIERI